MRQGVSWRGQTCTSSTKHHMFSLGPERLGHPSALLRLLTLVQYPNAVADHGGSSPIPQAELLGLEMCQIAGVMAALRLVLCITKLNVTV